MTNEKIFKTKTGFCHVLPDKIILTKDGDTASITHQPAGNNILPLLIAYLVVAAGFFYFAFRSYQQGEIVLPIVFGAIGLYVIFSTINSLNNSTTPVIYRKDIRSVMFKKAVPGISRSRFEVKFENERGKIKTRLILLPGSVNDGENETQKALQIMKEEGLIR